ncbi:sulfate transporter [Caballeronia arvi]|uniref:Sulfate transporter n=1 Tax=Caballeronia arvi TaxID=1777135 RepID=A0A158L0I7_9BURK|nr:sulfate transporter [Caballeronia arvi]
MIGFLTGVDVQVAAGELAGLFGLAKHGQGPVMQIVSVLQRIAAANYPTMVLSLAVLAVIFGCKRLAPRAPGALIAVIGSIAASAMRKDLSKSKWSSLVRHSTKPPPRRASSRAETTARPARSRPLRLRLVWVGYVGDG